MALTATAKIRNGDHTMVLLVGTYRKVSNRAGKAHLTLKTDGSLFYTNRREETKTLTPAQWLRHYDAGMSTHDSELNG